MERRIDFKCWCPIANCEREINTTAKNQKKKGETYTLGLYLESIPSLGHPTFVCFELHLLDCLCQEIIKGNSVFSLLRSVVSSMLFWLLAQCCDGEENKSPMHMDR